jgi:hypothetical protein
MDKTERRAILSIAVFFVAVVGILAALIAHLAGGSNPVLAHVTNGNVRLTGWGWFVLVWAVVAA